MIVRTLFCTGALLLVGLSTEITPFVKAQNGDALSAPQRERSSQIERLKRTLQYGIDSEVIDILPNLIAQRVTELAPSLTEILQRSTNDTLLEAALRYFRTLQLFVVEEQVLDILRDFERRTEKVLLEGVQYLKDSPHISADTLALLREMAFDERVVVARSALDAVGRHGTIDEGPYLVEIIDNGELPSDVRAGAILALGDVGYSEAGEALLAILADTSEEVYLRRYAATSVGKLQQADHLDRLRLYLNDSNATIRAHTVEAVGNYHQEGVTAILEEALRDSYWQVRLRALEALEGHKRGERVQRAIEYKVEFDPDNRVREAAIGLLSRDGGQEGYSFLRRIVRYPTLALAQRVLIARILVEHDYEASKGVITEMVSAELSRRRPLFLAGLAREMATVDISGAIELYALFLESESRAVVSWGLQGIGRNNLHALEPQIVELQEKSGDVEIKRTAALVLERWGDE